MRPPDGHQIGAPRHQDAIGLIRVGDVAHRHRGQPRLVADAVGKRRLEHPPIDGPGQRRRLARRHVDDIRPRRVKRLRDGHRFIGRHAVISPVRGRDAHRHRPVVRPDGAHGGEHLQRPAQAVLQAAAIVIRAPVRHRRQKARQQIAVCRVQFDHVEARRFGHAGRGNELRGHRFHVGAGHLLRHGVAVGPG